MKMHRGISALLVLLGSIAIAAQDKSSLILEDGTPIRLRLGRTVSSEDSHVGDKVDFEVLEEVRVNDVLVIRKGALALGTITVAEPKRRMARGGKLGINIDDVKLVSGEKAALRAVKDVKGGGHTGGHGGRHGCDRIPVLPGSTILPVHAWSRNYDSERDGDNGLRKRDRTPGCSQISDR